MIGYKEHEKWGLVDGSFHFHAHGSRSPQIEPRQNPEGKVIRRFLLRQLETETASFCL